MPTERVKEREEHWIHGSLNHAILTTTTTRAGHAQDDITVTQSNTKNEIMIKRLLQISFSKMLATKKESCQNDKSAYSNHGVFKLVFL